MFIRYNLEPVFNYSYLKKLYKKYLFVKQSQYKTLYMGWRWMKNIVYERDGVMIIRVIKGDFN